MQVVALEKTALHRNFIYNVAIPKLKYLYGLKTVVLRADKTMWDDFHTVRVRGENAGKLRGFPIPGHGITEEMAMEMCKKVGLRSPIYDITSRNGCFFCPNASMREIRHLYYHHPTLWRFLHQLQETPNTSRNCFTRSKTVFDYEKQFKAEERRKQKCSQADFHI